MAFSIAAAFIPDGITGSRPRSAVIAALGASVNCARMRRCLT
jgi:hypothetical protein